MTAVTALWGKSTGSGEYHPLICHMVDVAAVTLQLWNHVFQEGLRRSLSQGSGMPADQARAWLAFWAGSHDLGKATPGFQRLIPAHQARLSAAGFTFPRIRDTEAAHGLLTVPLLAHLLSHPAASTGSDPDVPVWPSLGQPWAQKIARTVAGHHGTFAGTDAARKVTRHDLGEGAWEEARHQILTELASFTGVTDVAVPPFPGRRRNAFLMTLAGLTSVADWIGSDERYFPSAGEAVDLRGYFREASGKAENALDALGWTGWQGRDEIGDFRSVFPHLKSPRPVQVHACELAREIDGPALVIIEAPTGEGKTEAAFYLGAEWNARLRQEGCYVALPTQATSNQMHGRTGRFLSQLYSEEKVNLHLLHSGAALRDLESSLRPRGISPEGEEDDTPNVVAEEWFKQAKRGLLAPFAVGTVDQVLLSVLQTRHVFVRLFGLANKTIVIDEVHAYDTYMTTLLERLLEWLRSLDCTVILLSATLPSEKRVVLLRAFAGGEVEVQETPYPRITWAVRGEAKADHFETDRSLARTVQLEQRPDDFGTLAEGLTEALADGGCVACVCNTVARAQRLYETLREHFREDEIILFHSRFPFGRRKELEDDILTQFGKEESQRPGRIVLVATQVIEQSLDVDFDLMVTDIAPVDLIIQRAGRLHRHRRRKLPRPARLRTPRLWVLAPGLDDSRVPDLKEIAPVYDDYVLLRSYLALEGRDSLELPEEVEQLVESVYGEEAYPQLSPEWHEALAQSQLELRKHMEKEQWCARTNLIRSPAAPGDILDDFCQRLEEENPEVHRSLQALTRLGNPSIQVVCLHRAGGSMFMDADGVGTSDLDRPPTKEETRSLLYRSLSISHRGLYDRLKDMPVPKGWQRSALLRHHRVLVFEDGRVRLGNYRLRLDSVLGLVIEKGA